jgi:hypothetical protein
MNEYKDAKDVRGNQIKIGDIIVYPVRRRSTMVLKEATVCDVPGKGCAAKEGIVALNTRGRRVIISRPDRCAVVSDFMENRRKTQSDN